MNIYINGQLDFITPPCTLYDLLINKGINNEFMAVAKNDRFIPRSLLKTTYLEAQDRIDCIIPMQGG